MHTFHNRPCFVQLINRNVVCSVVPIVVVHIVVVPIVVVVHTVVVVSDIQHWDLLKVLSLKSFDL